MKRQEVEENLTWDLSLIYANDEIYKKEVEKMNEIADYLEKTYKGKLTNASQVNACLDAYREMLEIMILAEHYTDLAVSVDYTNGANVSKNQMLQKNITEIMSRLSFVDSEISELSDQILMQAIEESKENRGYLSGVLREKPHRLAPEAERVIAALGQTLGTPYEIYNTAKLADIQFPSYEVDGKIYPLSYSEFEDLYEYEKNTKVRRKAFEVFSHKIAEYRHLTAAAYQAQVQKEKVMATLRGFDSVFDSLLFSQRVERELYDRQIDLIMEKLSVHMRKLAKLIKEYMDLKK